MEYLCRELGGPVPLGELARHCGLSPSRLSHLFREQVGRTPQQFLEMQRMNQSQRAGGIRVTRGRSQGSRSRLPPT